jgi:hypothetical protein
MQQAPPKVRFIDSMPRPLLIVFLLFAAGGVALVIVLLTRPPAPKEVSLALRRSPPTGAFTHDVVRTHLVDIPEPLPPFRAPCAALNGLVIEGGVGAQHRLAGPDPDKRRTPLSALCDLVKPSAVPPPAEMREAILALSTGRIRFALFARTGVLSTTDLSQRRIMLAIALSRTNVHPLTIAPLLVHEGYHLAKGSPVTATQEYFARVAELEACRLLIDVDDFPRGCADANAIVRLGQIRAVELLVRAGFPQ